MRILLVFLLCSFQLTGQDLAVSKFAEIPPALIKNANAVIKHSEVTLEINAQDELVQKEHAVITILNSRADYLSEIVQYYNQDTKIVTLELKVFNAFNDIYP